MTYKEMQKKPKPKWVRFMSLLELLLIFWVKFLPLLGFAPIYTPLFRNQFTPKPFVPAATSSCCLNCGRSKLFYPTHQKGMERLSMHDKLQGFSLVSAHDLNGIPNENSKDCSPLIQSLGDGGRVRTYTSCCHATNFLHFLR